MTEPELTLHGPTYASYVKTVQLALEEKGLAYRMAHFDFSDRPATFTGLNPFNKAPALAHGDFVLYEAVAICRYVDEGFEGPPLQPAHARDRARMAQVIAIMDQVGAPTMARTIFRGRYAQRVLKQPFDETKITEAVESAALCLGALEALLGDDAFFAGSALSLADCFVYPCLGYFGDTDEGEALLAERHGLTAWMARLTDRPTFQSFGLPDLPAPKLVED